METMVICQYPIFCNYRCMIYVKAGYKTYSCILFRQYICCAVSQENRNIYTNSLPRPTQYAIICMKWILIIMNDRVWIVGYTIDSCISTPIRFNIMHIYIFTENSVLLLRALFFERYQYHLDTLLAQRRHFCFAPPSGEEAP